MFRVDYTDLEIFIKRSNNNYVEYHHQRDVRRSPLPWLFALIFLEIVVIMTLPWTLPLGEDFLGVDLGIPLLIVPALLCVYGMIRTMRHNHKPHGDPNEFTIASVNGRYMIDLSHIVWMHNWYPFLRFRMNGQWLRDVLRRKRVGMLIYTEPEGQYDQVYPESIADHWERWQYKKMTPRILREIVECNLYEKALNSLKGGRTIASKKAIFYVIIIGVAALLILFATGAFAPGGFFSPTPSYGGV